MKPFYQNIETGKMPKRDIVYATGHLLYHVKYCFCLGLPTYSYLINIKETVTLNVKSYEYIACIILT